MNIGRNHLLSFVALCGFAVFAMGTSKAKEEGGEGGAGGGLRPRPFRWLRPPRPPLDPKRYKNRS